MGGYEGSMGLFLAFRNLFRNFRRTIAIVFTVALGAGALFAFDGFINGVFREYRYNAIHANYGFGQIYTKGYRDTVFQEPVKHWIQNENELTNFLLSLEEVEEVFPRASFSALLKKGGITVSGLGQGIKGEKEGEFFQSLNVEKGVTLSTQPNGILLGYGLAKALNVEPGDTVTVVATSTKGLMKEGKFVVTGIFHTGSIDFDSRIFRIQLPEAQKLLKTRNIELVSLALRNLSDWESVAEKVEKAFPSLEATPFHILDKLYYKHTVDWLQAEFRIVQTVILGIVLLSVFNTVSASILERKQEIGNLRANGESVFQIMRLILTEGALLAVLGGVIGMALAYSLLMLFVDKGLLMPPGPGQTRQFVVIFHFRLAAFFFTLLLGTIAAMVASLLAGMRVAKTSIAQLLRSY